MEIYKKLNDFDEFNQEQNIKTLIKNPRNKFVSMKLRGIEVCR